MSEFAVWALGADRPGIVAAVTGALYEQGGNLKDCSMTVLSGHFAMMMLVEGPDELSATVLDGALAGARADFDLTVAVRPVGEAAPVAMDGDAYIVSVYGSDQPGILHRIATVLARSNANITDVNTRIIGDVDEPVYAMLLEVTLPSGLEPAVLEERLRREGKLIGVDTSLHPADADVL